jgi:hypothetical protein
VCAGGNGGSYSKNGSRRELDKDKEEGESEREEELEKDDNNDIVSCESCKKKETESKCNRRRGRKEGRKEGIRDIKALHRT